MKSCSIIIKVSGVNKDTGHETDAENKLKKNKLSIYAETVFNYCLQVNENVQEKADEQDINKLGKNVMSELNVLSEEYVDTLLTVLNE